MATTPQALLSAANCYQCYGASWTMLQLMKLALLRQWMALLDPSRDTSPQALLAEAKCYECYGANLYMLQLMKLSLWKQLADNAAPDQIITEEGEGLITEEGEEVITE